MANDATTWAMTHPSHMEPGIVLQLNQKSDFIYALGDAKLRVQLASEDKNVYLRQLAVRTKVSSGQAGSNQIPSCSITTGLASAPTYLQQVRAEYDHHQTAMMALWNTSIVEAQRLAMRQGHYISMRNKCLYGTIPSNGEGIVNATGAYTTALPPDSLGDQSFSSYDYGQMLIFVLGIFQLLRQRTYQFNVGGKSRFVVIGPQEVIGLWEQTQVIQLTSYQRPGAGSATVGMALRKVLEENDCELMLGYDDSLIGQGPGGTDIVIFALPEIEVPKGPDPNTNAFGSLMPNFNYNITQYADVAAPIEIPTPLAGGAIDVLSEMRLTTGWVIRPECLQLVYGAH